jgi:Surface antigen variable number repeat
VPESLCGRSATGTAFPSAAAISPGMKSRFLAAAALCFTVLLFPQSKCLAETDCTGSEFVVVQASFPSQMHLSSQEQAFVRLRLAGRCFDHSQLGETAERVRDAFQNLGYFRAKVPEPTLQVLDEKRQPKPVSLTFEVNEGARFTLSELRWLGVRAFQAEQIMQLMPMRPGDIFDTSKVREVLDGVKRLYISSGFPNAAIVAEVDADDVGHRVVLTFRVTDGGVTPLSEGQRQCSSSAWIFVGGYSLERLCRPTISLPTN